MAATQRELILWRVFWFLALLVIVGLTAWGASAGSAWLRHQQVASEIGQLQRMLESFRQRHGKYPVVFTNHELLQCLLGRTDPEGRPIKEQPWFLAGTRLYFRETDPLLAGNEIVDPWGRPYIYQYIFALHDRPENYVVASSGSDRRHSPPMGWFPGQNGTAPEDLDNIWVNASDQLPRQNP